MTEKRTGTTEEDISRRINEAFEAAGVILPRASVGEKIIAATKAVFGDEKGRLLAAAGYKVSRALVEAGRVLEDADVAGLYESSERARAAGELPSASLDPIMDRLLETATAFVRAVREARAAAEVAKGEADVKALAGAMTGNPQLREKALQHVRRCADPTCGIRESLERAGLWPEKPATP
jgi:hypothetical protein